MAIHGRLDDPIDHVALMNWIGSLPQRDLNILTSNELPGLEFMGQCGTLYVSPAAMANIMAWTEEDGRNPDDAIRPLCELN